MLQHWHNQPYTTCCLNPITHLGTEHAGRCLTSVTLREPVLKRDMAVIRKELNQMILVSLFWLVSVARRLGLLSQLFWSIYNILVFEWYRSQSKIRFCALWMRYGNLHWSFQQKIHIRFLLHWRLYFTFVFSFLITHELPLFYSAHAFSNIEVVVSHWVFSCFLKYFQK